MTAGHVIRLELGETAQQGEAAAEAAPGAQRWRKAAMEENAAALAEAAPDPAVRYAAAWICGLLFLAGAVLEWIKYRREVSSWRKT